MRNILQRFGKAKDGLAAVEFAFVLPVMLSFFMGLVELGQALSCRADVVNIASVGADLIGQEASVSQSDLTNVYSALGAMLFPFPTTGAQITITSIIDSGTAGSGKVAWSCTQGGTARVKNTTVTLPNSGLIPAGGGGSVILAEVSYSYASPISTYFVPNVTWSNSFYTRPRRVAQVAGPATCP